MYCGRDRAALKGGAISLPATAREAPQRLPCRPDGRLATDAADRLDDRRDAQVALVDEISLDPAVHYESG